MPFFGFGFENGKWFSLGMVRLLHVNQPICLDISHDEEGPIVAEEYQSETLQICLEHWRKNDLTKVKIA